MMTTLSTRKTGRSIVKFARTPVLAIAFSLLAAGGVAAALPSLATSDVDPQLAHGVWITESGNLEIEIAPCADSLCGTVSKVLSDRSMLDPRKPARTADGRPLVGLKILTDFTLDGGAWTGRIYNRENGKTYDCMITVAAQDTLHVRGYKGLPVIGKTQVWKRVQASDGMP